MSERREEEEKKCGNPEETYRKICSRLDAKHEKDYTFFEGSLFKEEMWKIVFMDMFFGLYCLEMMMRFIMSVYNEKRQFFNSFKRQRCFSRCLVYTFLIVLRERHHTCTTHEGINAVRICQFIYCMYNVYGYEKKKFLS